MGEDKFNFQVKSVKANELVEILSQITREIENLEVVSVGSIDTEISYLVAELWDKINDYKEDKDKTLDFVINPKEDKDE